VATGTVALGLRNVLGTPLRLMRERFRASAKNEGLQQNLWVASGSGS
jgi:hypothetical protein